MYINSVQGCNSQSFGMSFHLKGDGARKLATLLDDVNTEAGNHIMEDLIKPMKDLKTRVIYDGQNVIVEPPAGKKVADFMNADQYAFSLKVEEDKPKLSPNYQSEYTAIFEYPTNLGRYEVNYGPFVDFKYEPHPFMQKLFNAREIARDMDSVAKYQEKTSIQRAAKEARIEEKAKILQDLYA